jgi:hypothetical protein
MQLNDKISMKFPNRNDILFYNISQNPHSGNQLTQGSSSRMRMLRKKRMRLLNRRFIIVYHNPRIHIKPMKHTTNRWFKQHILSQLLIRLLMLRKNKFNNQLSSYHLHPLFMKASNNIIITKPTKDHRLWCIHRLW